MTDAAVFRAQFPVLERVSYLNAGTNGPVPRRAMAATERELRTQLDEGRRGLSYFGRCLELATELRAGAARLLGCDAKEVALTGSTTDGVNTVVSGLALGAGDEVLTSDEEHPGLLAPLAGARRRRGIEVRIAPFGEMHRHVGRATRLVACSHVSWLTGRVLQAEQVAATGVPVLLDGAQGLGAVPVDVGALGCDFYAAAGQKWLCGPNGSGFLYVRQERIGSLHPPWPGYESLSDPDRPLELSLREGAARYDLVFPASHHIVWSLVALDVLVEAGIEWVHGRAATMAARLAAMLSERGRRVAPRDRSTLVSWEAEEPEAEAERLAAEGIVVRSLPQTRYVRASVGAWNSEEELERVVELASGR